MSSTLIRSGAYREIAGGVRELVNAGGEILTAATAASPRAAGDAIETLVKNGLRPLLGGHCREYRADFERRAMADIEFTDPAGYRHIVDVKTHLLTADFSMPNLTSVKRLLEFYRDERNLFLLLLIPYRVVNHGVRAEAVTFVPIEHIHWDCLRIGALGTGQIQLANASVCRLEQNPSRKRWMEQFCRKTLDFYAGEQRKIRVRVTQFEEALDDWSRRI
jgi:hypothetical protein